MFTLQPKPTFKAEVLIHGPGGGDAKLKLEFAHLGKKALKEFYDSMKVEEGAEPRDDLDAISEIVVGWDGVDTPFSKDALAKLLDNYPSAAFSILEAYSGAVFEAKRKN